MNFDVFEDIKVPNKNILLEKCKAAEKNALIDPFSTFSNARSALEELCKGLLKTDKNSRKTLNVMIKECIKKQLFSNKDAAYLIKDNGNAALHGNKNVNYHKVVQSNIDKAVKVCSNLYDLMKQVFDNKIKEYPKFDANKIPFGDYEITRRVPKSDSEIIVGKYNYFTHISDKEFYYFQIFSKNSKDSRLQNLSARNELTRTNIKRDKKRQSYLLETIVPFETSEDSDRQYIAYLIYEDSFLLSEYKGRMSQKQALGIGLDLVKGLLEMKNVLSGIHHRNIQPGCIMITPDGSESYMASLVNMETSKVNDYEYTVFTAIKGMFRKNPFMPREVRDYKEGQQEIDWEKADLYSVAKVMIYCIAPELVKEETDADDLFDIFSDEMVETFRVIFESSLDEIYTLEEFERILENEIDRSC